jgi:hypothetical protein
VKSDELCFFGSSLPNTHWTGSTKTTPNNNISLQVTSTTLNQHAAHKHTHGVWPLQHSTVARQPPTTPETFTRFRLIQYDVGCLPLLSDELCFFGSSLPAKWCMIATAQYKNPQTSHPATLNIVGETM